MIHEAGHLATAKIFKVYCFEYAIGFGPKIFSKKRKNGETYFSIRAIPFGGFVSMYGESDTVPEGLNIDPSRSLLAIKKWKRAIIMAAGVIMNFLLAIVIFFVYEVAFPTYTGRYGHVYISENSIAYNAGIRSQDLVYAMPLSYGDAGYVFYDDSAVLDTSDGEKLVYLGFNYNTLAIKDTSLRNHAVAFEKLTFGKINDTYPSVDYATVMSTTYPEGVTEYVDVSGYLNAIYVEKVDNKYNVELAIFENYSQKETDKPIIAKMTLTEENYNILTLVPRNTEAQFTGDLVDRVIDGKTYKYLTVKEYEMPYPNVLKSSVFSNYGSMMLNKLSFDLCVYGNSSKGRGTATTFNNLTLEKGGDTYYLPENLGISMQLDTSYNNFGQALKETFIDFGDASTAIFKGLYALIATRDGWKEVGGIISIGVVTTQVLQQNGFGQFLRVWGLISVNLGIVNLLPFPGLDGWHLLVIAIEGIFRKEIPAKVKNAVALVGLILLFSLMVLIIVKDIVGLI